LRRRACCSPASSSPLLLLEPHIGRNATQQGARSNLNLCGVLPCGAGRRCCEDAAFQLSAARLIFMPAPPMTRSSPLLRPQFQASAKEIATSTRDWRALPDLISNFYSVQQYPEVLGRPLHLHPETHPQPSACIPRRTSRAPSTLQCWIFVVYLPAASTESPDTSPVCCR